MASVVMTQTLTPLTLDQLPLCQPLAKEFWDERHLPGTFNMDHFTQSWTTLMATQPAVIFGLFYDGELVGALGGLVAPDIHTGEIVANEFFWFVLRKARKGTGAIRLIREFEHWGEENGATGFHLTAIIDGHDDARLDKLYQRFGYTALEKGYVRHVKEN